MASLALPAPRPSAHPSSEHNFKNGGRFVCFATLIESLSHIFVCLLWPCPSASYIVVTVCVRIAFFLFFCFCLKVQSSGKRTDANVLNYHRRGNYQQRPAYNVYVSNLNPQRSARRPTCWTLSEEPTNNDVIARMLQKKRVLVTTYSFCEGKLAFLMVCVCHTSYLEMPRSLA